jgi:glycine cleavage system H protein
MSELPNDLKYTSTHEWVKLDDEGHATVGITDHAQHLLGDMVYIELPHLEANISAGDECAVLESVKAAADFYTPLSGEVVAVNEDLAESPGLVNSAPYDKGWIMKLRIQDDSELSKLLDADAYNKEVENNG